jgi:hypothetical protein
MLAMESELIPDLSPHVRTPGNAHFRIPWYCRPPKSTRFAQIPSLWGPLGKGEDPYAPVEQAGCCSGRFSTPRQPQTCRRLQGSADLRAVM